MGTTKGYADGVAYAEDFLRRSCPSPERVRDNVAFVRDAVRTAGKGAPTRGFWLGFARRLRAVEGVR